MNFAAQVFELFGVIAIDNDPALESLREVEQQAESTTSTLNDTLTSMGRGIRSVGLGVTAVFGPLGLLQGKAVKLFQDFESQMLTVQALTGATTEQYEHMGRVARDLGASTVFTAKDAAEGMALLAMAGLNVEETLAAIGGMLDTAAAGTISLADAADIVTNVMMSFQYEASRTAEVGDILANAANSSNTNILGLGHALSYVGATASGLGMTLEDSVAGIAVLANMGIRGSRAGRTFSTMLADMAKKSKDLGLDIWDAAGNMKAFPEVLAEIEKQGWSTVDILETFGQISGRTLVSFMAAGTETVAEFSEMLYTTSDGISTMVAEIKMSGLFGVFEELQGALEELGLAIVGAGLGDLIRDWVERITEVVRALAKLDPRFLRLISMVVGTGAALGPMLLILGQAMIMFAGLANPIGIIITALVLLGVTIGNIATNFEVFRDIVDVLDVALKQFTGRGLRDFQRAFQALGTSIAGAIKSAWNFATQPFYEIGVAIVQGLISGIQTGGSRVINAAKTWILGLIDNVKGLLGISSPSTVFEALGRYVVEGFFSGLLDFRHVATYLNSLLEFQMQQVYNEFGFYGGWFVGRFLEAVQAEFTASRLFRLAEMVVAGTIEMAMAMYRALFLGFWVIFSQFGVDLFQVEKTVIDSIKRLAAPMQPFVDSLVQAFTDAYYKVDKVVYMLEESFILFGKVLLTYARFFSQNSAVIKIALQDLANSTLEGFLRGIQAGASIMYAEVKQWILGFIDTVKGVLGISSPSTVFESLGRYVVEGFFNGLFEFTHVARYLNSILEFQMQQVYNEFGFYGGWFVGRFLQSIQAEFTASRLFRLVGMIIEGVLELAWALYGTLFIGLAAIFDQFGVNLYDLEGKIIAMVRNTARPLQPFLQGILADFTKAYYQVDKVVYLFEEVFILFGKILLTYARFFGQNSDVIGQAFRDMATSSLEGFIRGLQAGAAILYVETKAIIKRLIDTVKNVLGISSPSTVFIEFGQLAAQGFAIGFLTRFANIERELKAAVIMSLGLMRAAFTKFSRDTALAFHDLTGVARPVSDTFVGTEETISRTFDAIKNGIDRVLPVIRVLLTLMFGDFMLAFWLVRGVLKGLGVDIDGFVRSLQSLGKAAIEPLIPLLETLNSALTRAYLAVDRFAYNTETSMMVFSTVFTAIVKSLIAMFGNVIMAGFQIYIKSLQASLLIVASFFEEVLGIQVTQIAWAFVLLLQQIADMALMAWMAVAASPEAKAVQEYFDRLAEGTVGLRQAFADAFNGINEYLREHERVVKAVVIAVSALLLGRYTALGKFAVLALVKVFDALPMIMSQTARSFDNILKGMGLNTGTALLNIQAQIKTFGNVLSHTTRNFSMGALKQTFLELQEVIRVTMRMNSYTLSRFKLEVREMSYAIKGYIDSPTKFMGQLGVVIQHRVKQILALIAVLTTQAIPSLLKGLLNSSDEFGNTFVNLGRIIMNITEVVTTAIGQILVPILSALSKQGGVFEHLGNTLRIVVAIVSILVGYITDVVREFTTQGTVLNRMVVALARMIGEVLVGALKILNSLLSAVASLLKGDFIGALKFSLQALWHLVEGVYKAVKEVAYAIVSMWWGAEAEAAARDAMGKIERFVGAIVGFFANLPNAIGNIWTVIKTVVSNIFQGIVDAILGFPSWYKGVFNDMVAWLEDLPRHFFNIGVNIMKGLLDGLASMGNNIKTSVTNAGNAIISTFKSALGIHSPSTITYEAGQDLVKGFTLGFDSVADAAAQNVKTFGDRISGLFDFSASGKFENQLISKAQIQNTIMQLLQIKDTLQEAGLEGTKAFADIEEQLQNNMEQLDKVNTKLLEAFDLEPLIATRDELEAVIAETQNVMRAMEESGQTNTKVYLDLQDDLTRYEKEHGRTTTKILEREAMAARFLQITGLTVAQFRAQVLGLVVDAEEDLAELREDLTDQEVRNYDEAYLARQRLFQQEDAWYRALVENGNASLEEWIRVLDARLLYEGLTAEEIMKIEEQIFNLRMEISENNVEAASRSVQDRLALEFAGLDAMVEITKEELNLLKAKYDFAVLTAEDSAAFEIEMLRRVAQAKGLSEIQLIEIQSSIYSHQERINARTVKSAKSTSEKVVDVFKEMMDQIQHNAKLIEIRYELRLVNYEQTQRELNVIKSDLQGRINEFIIRGDTNSEEFQKLAEALASVDRQLESLQDSNRTAWLNKLEIQARHGIRPIQDIKSELLAVKERIETDIAGFRGLATTPEVLDSLVRLTTQLKDVDAVLESLSGDATSIWLDKLATQAALGTRPLADIREELERSIASTQEKIAAFGTTYGGDLDTLRQVQELYALLQRLEGAYESVNEQERESLTIQRELEDAAASRITNSEQRLETEISLLETRLEFERGLLREGQHTNSAIIAMEQDLYNKRQDLIEAQIASQLKALEDGRAGEEASFQEQLEFLERKKAMYLEYGMDVEGVEKDILAVQRARAQAEIDFEERKHRYLVEVGQISAQEHLEWLAAKLAGETEFSAEWVRLQQEMAKVQEDIDKKSQEEADAEIAMDERRHRHLVSIGKISQEQHLAWLEERLSEQEEFSEAWIRTISEILSVEKYLTEERKKELEEIANADERIHRYRLKIGEVTLEQHLVWLTERLAKEEEFTSEWINLQLEISQTEEEIAKLKKERTDEEIADEDRRMRHLYKVQQISKADFILWLRSRLEGLEEFSEEWIKIVEELYELEKKEQDKSKDRWKELREEIEKTYSKKGAKQLALLSVDIREIGEAMGGTAGQWAEGAAEIIEGISLISEHSLKTKEGMLGLSQAINAFAGFLPEATSETNKFIQGLFGTIGMIAELVFQIPGLGAVFAAVGNVISRVIGDLSNGIKQVAAEVKDMQKSFKLLDVSKIVRTHRVSRGGILGWLGFTKEAIDQVATDLAMAIGTKLEGVGNVLSSAMKNFISGATDAGGVFTELQAGVRGAIEDAIIEAVIQGAIFKGAIGGLLTELTNALAAGEDPTSIIKKINDALPGVRDTIIETLEPLRDTLDETFGRHTDTGGGSGGERKRATIVRDPTGAFGDQSIDSRDLEKETYDRAHLSLIRQGNEGIIGTLEDIKDVLVKQGSSPQMKEAMVANAAGTRNTDVHVTFKDKIVIREEADIDRIADTIAKRVRDADKGM